jgi:threonine synthase
MGQFNLVCGSCGVRQSAAYSPFCQQCNQMTEAVFDLKKAALHDSPNPYDRFFDLLPVNDRSLLPREITYTPCVHAQKLGQRLGMPRLYLKNETVLPTRTTKYRMAAVSLPYLYESGVKHFCTSSTGNSSTAYAQLMPNVPSLKMSLFTGSQFRARVNYETNPQIHHYVLRDGNFVEAFDCAASFAKEHGHTSERGFFNVGRRQGLKLAFSEATDQVPHPIDWYVQAVSSAMGVYGTWTGAKELLAIGHIARLPHLLCVQQETCAPMVGAWREGAESIGPQHIVRHPTGIAMAILRGDPSRVYPYVRRVVRESEGEMTAVSEAQIRDAQRLVRDLEGIEICFSASTAVAGLIQSVQSGRVPTEHCVMINLTGGDRTSDVVSDDITLLDKIDGTWQPSANQVFS